MLPQSGPDGRHGTARPDGCLAGCISPYEGLHHVRCPNYGRRMADSPSPPPGALPPREDDRFRGPPRDNRGPPPRDDVRGPPRGRSPERFRGRGPPPPRGPPPRAVA